ncbi:hypothetical protein MTO96_012078 [Rhipicephalus appendiculatus]
MKGRWTTLLARQAVTPARDQGEHEEKVLGEGEPEEADDGEKLNNGEVHTSEYSEEAGGEAEISTTEEAENVNREAQAIVHDADNHDVDVYSEYEAAAAKAGETTRTPECVAGVDAKTQAAKSIVAAVVAEAIEDAPRSGKAHRKKPAARKTKPACNAVVAMEPAAVDNESSRNLQVSGLAISPQIANQKALFCEHDPGGALCESPDKAEFAMTAATETVAAGKNKVLAAKSRLAAARSTSCTSATSRVRLMSTARFASTGGRNQG